MESSNLAVGNLLARRLEDFDGVFALNVQVVEIECLIQLLDPLERGAHRCNRFLSIAIMKVGPTKSPHEELGEPSFRINEF